MTAAWAQESLSLLLSLLLHGLVLSLFFLERGVAVPIQVPQPPALRVSLVPLHNAPPVPQRSAAPRPAPAVPVATRPAQPASSPAAAQSLPLPAVSREEPAPSPAPERAPERVPPAAASPPPAAQEQAADAAAAYVEQISHIIAGHWSRPPDARREMRAELLIQLIPTGEVVGVRVVRSSGHAAFDASAEAAVWRSGGFPEIRNMPRGLFERRFRRLRLLFRPEDLYR